MTAAIEAQVAPDLSARVLLLAPTGRDADVTSAESNRSPAVVDLPPEPGLHR